MELNTMQDIIPPEKDKNNRIGLIPDPENTNATGGSFYGGRRKRNSSLSLSLSC